MSGFSSGWLALREPLDAVSRNRLLMESVTRWRCGLESLVIADLGCGTGSNVRYLAPRLGGQQYWLLVDHDPKLLAAASSALTVWAEAIGASLSRQEDALSIEHEDFSCRVRLQAHDLAGELAHLPLDGVQLVTASALLDLVSEAWLVQLAAQCKQVGAAVLFALTYDGTIRWTPVDPGDETVRQAVNRHQRTDKGFGVALGPRAAQAVEAVFSAQGYQFRSERSDWRIGPDGGLLQKALLDDWTGAVAGDRSCHAGQV
ncbi:MAG: class I SAM-dependent methyltransferase [Candidatus Competibacteraceae bacterium]